MKFLRPAQVSRFLESAGRHPEGDLWIIAVATASRLSELQGLIWDKVDLTTGKIRITRSLQRLNRQWIVQDPKTERSRRPISLPQVAVVHHSDRGVQPRFLAIRYTERLAESGALRSVGSRGDSYHNALAETVNGLYKTELIRRRGPWRSLEQVELATAEWVEWWNHRRLHSAAGGVPPAEYEDHYYRQRDTTEIA
jgi:transposase InsO family protein